MIIKKDFDSFKKIVENKEKSKILLQPKNWFYALLFVQNYFNDQIVVKNDIITISFISDIYTYNAEFVRELTKNQIEIKNSKLGSIWWYFFNYSISKRIEYNWEEAIK